MIQQTRLPISVPQKLTWRQELALEILRASPKPKSHTALGQAVHHAQGKHGAGVICRFCADTGKELGKALRRKDGTDGKPLVRFRNGAGGGWYAVSHYAREAEEVDWPF